jgi:hypothetical protein
MSQQPPYNGEIGSSDRPTTISTDVLELLTQARAVDSLVGLARDSAEQQDGTVVYTGTAGGPTDLAVWVDGVKRPVTGVEWVDSNGVARPVTEWHLGPRSDFSVAITGTNGPVAEGETVDVSVEVTNTGAATVSDTITLGVSGSTVDSQSVSLGNAQTASFTLQWQTQSGDAGDRTLTVQSSDDSAQTTVTVDSAASGVHQYRAEDFAKPWPDNVGTADITVNGLSTSTVNGGETTVTGNGIDEFGQASPTQWDPSGEAAIEVVVAPATDGEVVGKRNSGGDRTVAGIGQTSNSNGQTAGVPAAHWRDPNDNRLSIEAESFVADREIHTIIWGKEGDKFSNGDYYITIDGWSEPLSVNFGENDDHENLENIDLTDMGFFATTRKGTNADIEDHIEADVLGFALHNSAVKTGTISYSVDNPTIDLNNAFAPTANIDTITNTDTWQSQADIVVTSDRWYLTWIEGDGHNVIGNSLKYAETTDGGATFENEQTVFAGGSTEWARDARMTEFDNGRLGIWFRRNDGNDDPLGLSFAYSDDGGNSWTVDDYDTFNANYLSFSILRYPSSVGGADTGGWIIHGDDALDGGDGDIYAITTTDNGDSWAESKVISNPSGYSSAGFEVSVARLGTDNKWVMLTRNESGGPSLIYTSTDLSNWSGPDEAPSPDVGDNPSSLFYHNGYLNWLAASRPYQYEADDSRAILSDNKFQGIVSRTVDADTIWNNPTNWPAWEVFAYERGMHFDLGIDTYNGDVYGILGTKENVDFSSFHGRAQLAILTSGGS